MASDVVVGCGNQVYDATSEAVRREWLWATGSTPFGPLSTSFHLSFAIVDAAARNAVLVGMHRVGTAVAHLLTHFASANVDVDAALAEDAVTFRRRWNFFRWVVGAHVATVWNEVRWPWVCD